PQHVQDPRALRIVVGVEEREEIRFGRIHDGPVDVRRADDALTIALHAGTEVGDPVRGLEEERPEVRGEAFRQPEVVPARLRDRVPEPLMGDLVRDGALNVPAGGDRLLRVEDGRRVLHAAEAGRGLNVGELLEWIRADGPGEEVDHLGGPAKRRLRLLDVLGEDPGRHLHATVGSAAGRRAPARGEAYGADLHVRGSDDHVVGRDWYPDLPDPRAAGARVGPDRVRGSRLRLAHEMAVRDDVPCL